MAHPKKELDVPALCQAAGGGGPFWETQYPCAGPQVVADPADFRTWPALQRTQAHLRRVMDRSDLPLATLHKFLWDRYRCLRQDIFMQGFNVRAPRGRRRNAARPPRAPRRASKAMPAHPCEP